jgi:D-alanyl-D-alanine dipeptidase
LIVRGRGGSARRLCAVAAALALGAGIGAGAAACGRAETGPGTAAESARPAGSALAPAPTPAAATNAPAAPAPPTTADAASNTASVAASATASVAASVAASAAASAAASIVPAEAKELVTAVVDDWDATRATLRRWRRTGAGWQPDGAPWPGVVGKSGAAWGVGLHGAGAPAGRGGPVKREGDGKSPAGAFALRRSYGYAKAPPAGTRLPYVPVDERWKCVDDPASQHYDQILDRTTVAPDWKSAEEMRREDALYAWVVDVAHNPARASGVGSCIFLHVWRGEGSTTAGCTAMDQRTLERLIATLDPSAVFVLLPRAEYAALAPAWALPPLP